jgi:hypothetical protein
VLVVLGEKDNNRDGARDTQLRFYYIILMVCVRHNLDSH